ncbi:transposase [Streptomyces sp. NPDC048483]|uniref:transposase n=1 Tax=Streptomyces sp. NPDC048483 TaxID=3154927 RepID=UPI003414EC67
MNCPNTVAPGKPSTSDTCCGRPTAPGRGFSHTFKVPPTSRAASTGTSTSTPPPCGPTSTPPEPPRARHPCHLALQGGHREDRFTCACTSPCGSCWSRRCVRRGPRPLPRRTDHQNPSCFGGPVPPAVPARHAGTASGLHTVRRGHGQDRRSPHRAGPTRRTPESVGADKAYSNRAVRAYLRRCGIRHVNPGEEGPQVGLPVPGFTRWAISGLRQGRYKDRNTVEGAMGKLRQFRAVATRYDKRGYVYLGTVAAAALVIWLRS